MADASDSSGDTLYQPFTGEDLRREQQELLDYIEHRRTHHGLHDDDFLTVSTFGHFALLNEIGWKRIRYESFRLASGQMSWMTDEHAMAIGRALRPTLTDLRIDLTTLAGDGFTLMADSMQAYLVLQYLCIAHRSGDEVTAVETRGLARLVSKTHAASLSLWASGFAEGALDVLADQLEQLENVWLREVDVCDLRKEEGQNEIVHPALNELVERNREE